MAREFINLLSKSDKLYMHSPLLEIGGYIRVVSAWSSLGIHNWLGLDTSGLEDFCLQLALLFLNSVCFSNSYQGHVPNF